MTFTSLFVSVQAEKAKQVEVEEMLQTILAFQQNDCNKDSAQIALVAHSLAMLWYLAGDSLKVSHLMGSGINTVTPCPTCPVSVWDYV